MQTATQRQSAPRDSLPIFLSSFSGFVLGAPHLTDAPHFQGGIIYPLAQCVYFCIHTYNKRERADRAQRNTCISQTPWLATELLIQCSLRWLNVGLRQARRCRLPQATLKNCLGAADTTLFAICQTGLSLIVLIVRRLHPLCRVSPPSAGP